jgi:hypothetical protein
MSEAETKLIVKLLARILLKLCFQWGAQKNDDDILDEAREFVRAKPKVQP